ncbi:MFS transporter [Alkalibacillus haloalkaliphilus]|uniref:Sugar transporter n=1 Tax=Alkalibacillus haloalkaliphilus TaxID=94136 RepID=A0A511W4F1_9BACI|nr:MFS transporter [Alkalibacillus haloalkaliphilus]GEN45984.1 sugar transporter [Alkalibacillus haloalkaliphilus]
MGASITGNEQNYHQAKLWQIAFFALNNTATNIYLFALGFVTYYATGVAGLAVVVVSTILAAMRAFDAITDPLIGFIIDKTETKFGKFMPIMIIGNIVLASSFFLMYNIHGLPENLQLFAFIFIHAIYIIGYTMQTNVTRAAQTVLTNHPKQRPLFSIFDSVYNILLFSLGQVYVSSYLVGKHGEDFPLSLFVELNTFVILLSALFTILAVIGIKAKDRKEFYGLADLSMKVRFRDFWPIIKGNRPLQMLVLSASTDKLAATMMQQQVVMVMLFGILLGNFALSGTYALLTIAPSLLITYIGVVYARKVGLKKTLVRASWLGVIALTVLSVILVVADNPSSANFEAIGFLTIAFVVLYSIGRGVSTLTPSIVIPMIADTSDYETYKTGRYVPGMISSLFSFVDKLVSSLAPALAGFIVALIGYQNEFPQIGEPLTEPLLYATIFAAFGVPILGWLISIIAMKFYKLDGETMKEIQAKIAEVKEEKSEVASSSNDGGSEDKTLVASNEEKK